MIDQAIIDPVTLTQALIKFPSITPKDEGVSDYLNKLFADKGFKITFKEFVEAGTEKVSNIYAEYGEGEKNLCFAGHYDVVPTGDKALWKYDPFSAQIEDGIIYGRGVVDMKGALAAFISAFDQYQQQNPDKSKYKISFLLTGDEEGPAINGTKKMLKHLQTQNIKIDSCIVGEPTNSNYIGDTIKIGRRGSINFNLKIIGKQGHIAYPQFAINPVTVISKIIAKLSNYPFDNKAEYFDASNLEFTNIKVSEGAQNVIAQEAFASFNIRCNDSYKPEELIQKIENIIKEITEQYSAQYELNYKVSAKAFMTKSRNLANLIKESAEIIVKQESKFSTSGGTSDARFIHEYTEVAEFGLINNTAHKIDEQIHISDIYLLRDIYFQVITNYFH